MTVATDNPTILVPIRYPLTAGSTQTLDRATQLADEYDTANLLVLHVDLFQYKKNATAREISQAIAPIIDGHPVAVSVRRGFLLEDVILEEVVNRRADIVVIGRNQKASWRQLLSRLVGNDPAVAAYLQDYTDAEIEIVG